MNPSNQPQEKKDGQLKKLVLALILLLLLLIGLVVGFVVVPALRGESRRSSFFDTSAKSGNLPGKTEEEIQAELDKVVEEGMFNISIASVVTVDANGTAAVRIENIAANHHNMTVAITLEGEDQPIYQSAGLAPGQYIETAPFTRTLPAGEYTATALFTAYDLDTLEPAGQAAAQITILVRS